MTATTLRMWVLAGLLALGSVLVAGARDCCCAPASGDATAAATHTPEHGCCSDTPEESTPAEDAPEESPDDGPCECPDACCRATAPAFSTPPAGSWAGEFVPASVAPVVGEGSAPTRSLESLIRPPIA